MFDHHRKSTDFIDKAVMVYHEPYASSTSELITEMIQYIGEKVKIKPLEADALLAGITVDTQNFSMKTGTITFEAAAYLKRCGADGIRVRKLLQEDMSVLGARASCCGKCRNDSRRNVSFRMPFLTTEIQQLQPHRRQMSCLMLKVLRHHLCFVTTETQYLSVQEALVRSMCRLYLKKSAVADMRL